MPGQFLCSLWWDQWTVWLGPISLMPDLSCSATWLSLEVCPLFSGRIQAVSGVCLPVLSCLMLGSSRRCPGCCLLLAPVSLFCYLWWLSLGFLPSPSSLILSSISLGLCHRREHFHPLLSGEAFLFPLLSLRGSLIMEAFLLEP